MKRINLVEFKDCFDIRENCDKERTIEVEITAKEEATQNKIMNTLQGISCLINGELRKIEEDCYQMTRGMTYIGDIIGGDSNDTKTVVIKSDEDLAVAAESLKAGQKLCIDLSQMPEEEAKKAFDFLSAMDYYLMGQIEKVQADMFLYTPEKKAYVESDDPIIIKCLDRAKKLYQEPETRASWMDEFTKVFTEAVDRMKEEKVVSPVALLYAQLLEEMGKTPVAIDVLKDYAEWCEKGLMHLHDYHILALLKLAVYHYMKQEHIDAEKHLKLLQDEVAREKLDSVVNDFHLQIYTDTLVKNGKRGEAKKHLKEFLKESQSPREQARLKAKIAKLYAEEGLFWKAVILYKESIRIAEGLTECGEKNSHLVNAKLDIADIFIKQGNDKNAVLYLEEVKALCNHEPFSNLISPIVHQKLGNCYAKLKKSENAIACYETVIQWHEERRERAVELIPKKIIADAHRCLGEQYFKKKQYNDAAKEFENAMEIYRADSKNIFSYAKEILFLQEYIVEMLNINSR